MKSKRQINGRRFVFALAAAELELRKQEGLLCPGLEALHGRELLLHPKVGPTLRTFKNNKTTIKPLIYNFNNALDWAMCFVLRYPGQLLFVAQSTINDNLGSKFRLAQYRKSKEFERWQREQEEDAALAEDGDAEWLETQRNWKPSPKQITRHREALAAQMALQGEGVQDETQA